MFESWFNLASATTLLAIESQEVIGLRLAKLAMGGSAARREAELMVHEKVMAFGEAFATASAGGSSDSVVAFYRRKVRANRRRLAR